MLCEICGERKAVARVKLDGVEFAVCPKCTHFGTVLVERRVAQKRTERVERDVEDIVPDYAGRIRKARENLGMNLEELAKTLMEKKTVLAKVERGKMLPNAKLVKKLEKFLGITIRGIVNGVTAESREKHPTATLGDLAVVKKR
jgi:putative transcription factor